MHVLARESRPDLVLWTTKTTYLINNQITGVMHAAGAPPTPYSHQLSAIKHKTMYRWKSAGEIATDGMHGLAGWLIVRARRRVSHMMIG